MVRCSVNIPGIGQCEVDGGDHEEDGRGRLIHRLGAISWNGGVLIEVEDAALDRARTKEPIPTKPDPGLIRYIGRI